MDVTPKLQRNSSLSLSMRLNKKRHNASPQNHLRTSADNIKQNSRELNSKTDSLQRSPSLISICSDGGIECTPPHKKISINLDESFEFSPKMFDTSFSPTCLLSQTLAIDSPEVGWKWSRYSGRSGDPSSGIETSSTRTPDSAYAADSSFASAGSSSTEVAGSAHITGNSYKQRNANGVRREDQRKIMEQELRRVEHTRAEEMLKQRCAKLQEQLKSAGTQKFKTGCLPMGGILEKNAGIICETSNSEEMKTQSNTKPDHVMLKFEAPESPVKTELLSDFFNDSDMDSFLLQATQEIESKIVGKAQPASINCARTQKSTNIPSASSAPAATTTPPSNKNIVYLANSMSSKCSDKKDKRSSFYMKFLEDDCPDEWFVSLDEAILQATESKKSRNSLQRYKSMPTESVGTSKVLLNKKDNNDNVFLSATVIPEESIASSSTFSKMKRHSSTHSLSPAGSHYRSRRQL